MWNDGYFSGMREHAVDIHKCAWRGQEGMVSIDKVGPDRHFKSVYPVMNHYGICFCAFYTPGIFIDFPAFHSFSRRAKGLKPFHMLRKLAYQIRTGRPNRHL